MKQHSFSFHFVKHSSQQEKSHYEGNGSASVEIMLVCVLVVFNNRLFSCYSSGLVQLQVRDQMLIKLVSMWSQMAGNLLTTSDLLWESCLQQKQFVKEPTIFIMYNSRFIRQQINLLYSKMVQMFLVSPFFLQSTGCLKDVVIGFQMILCIETLSTPY